MNAVTASAPIRRSALEAIHAALDRGRGAWPLSYGDPDSERRTVRETIGIAQPGLYDAWIVRGAGALTACRAAGLEGRPGSVTPAAPGGVNVWAVADDEVWLVAFAPQPGGPPLPAFDFGPVIEHVRGAGALATDVSSGWHVLRLVGPAVRDLLAEVVASDLAGDLVADHAILQVPFAGTRVVLARRDYEGIPGFTLLVPRDDAAYLWESLLELGAPHGVRPVGAGALLPSPAGSGDPR